jgi:hypothetical protein
MEANILINKNKFELKYIKVQPGKLVSDTLKPGYTKFQDGRYFWSKQTSYEVEPCWISDNLFDGITESNIKNSDKYQVVDGKLYLRPLLELIFDNDTLIERFDTDKELNERVLFLRGYVFTQPDVSLTQINTDSFAYKSIGSWY